MQSFFFCVKKPTPFIYLLGRFHQPISSSFKFTTCYSAFIVPITSTKTYFITYEAYSLKLNSISSPWTCAKFLSQMLGSSFFPITRSSSAIVWDKVTAWALSISDLMFFRLFSTDLLPCHCHIAMSFFSPLICYGAFVYVWLGGKLTVLRSFAGSVNFFNLPSIKLEKLPLPCDGPRRFLGHNPRNIHFQTLFLMWLLISIELENQLDDV